jgi:hypothetical protein
MAEQRRQHRHRQLCLVLPEPLGFLSENSQLELSALLQHLQIQLAISIALLDEFFVLRFQLRQRVVEHARTIIMDDQPSSFLRATCRGTPESSAAGPSALMRSDGAPSLVRGSENNARWSRLYNREYPLAVHDSMTLLRLVYQDALL